MIVGEDRNARFWPLQAGGRLRKVVVANLESQLLADGIKGVIDRAGLGEGWGSGDPVFLKPNLTYPVFKPGVTTRVDFVRAVAEYFVDKGCRVTIGEGPGGYNGFSMKSAFEAHGLNAVARHLGVTVVELSDWETEALGVQCKGGRTVEVPMPKALRHDFRALVSLPVPKVHCMTGVSLAIKNLWGCIPDSFRIRFHPYFSEIVNALMTALPVKGAVLDGLFGLDENGPMIDGVARQLNWVAAALDCGSHDVVVTRLLGIDPLTVPHLLYGMRFGTIPWPDQVNTELIGVEQQRFSIKRNMWNRLAVLTWLHPRLSWLVYLSPLAGPLHWLMYLIRRRPEDLSVRSLRGWQGPSVTSASVNTRDKKPKCG